MTIDDSGLGFVQSESDPSHRLPRPFQSFGRTTAAQDNQIIGIVDESRSKLFLFVLPPPVLEKTVHIEVGEQRADYSALRTAHLASLPTPHSPFSLLVELFHRNLQPLLDELQHPAIRDPSCYRRHEFVVWNRIEVLRQVGIDHVSVPLTQTAVYRSHRILGLLPRPIPVGIRFEVRLEDGLQHKLVAVCTTRSRIVGIPSGRAPPSGFGIITRRTGLALYVFSRSSFPSPSNHAATPFDSMSANRSPSTPGAPPLARHSLQAYSRMSWRYTLS